MTSDSRAVTTAVEQAHATAKLVESRALLTPAADAVTNLLELAKLTNRVLGDVSGGKTSTDGPPLNCGSSTMATRKVRPRGEIPAYASHRPQLYAIKRSTSQYSGLSRTRL
jgi:hypothetical protein